MNCCFKRVRPTLHLQRHNSVAAIDAVPTMLSTQVAVLITCRARQVSSAADDNVQYGRPAGVPGAESTATGERWQYEIECVQRQCTQNIAHTYGDYEGLRVCRKSVKLRIKNTNKKRP